jgi:hypothetical protein
MMNHGTRGHTEKGQRQGGTAGGTTSAAASARDAASIAQCRTTSNPAVDACPGLALGLALRCRAADTVARSAGRPGPGVRKHFRPTFVRQSVRQHRLLASVHASPKFIRPRVAPSVTFNY